MSKKPTKTPHTKSQTPAPEQIKAVERLIRTREFPKAIERARALAQRFPDHGSVNRLLLDALEQGAGKAAAAQAAFQWSERRPNSRAAQEAFLPFALEANYALLASRVGVRLGHLGIGNFRGPSTESLREVLAQPDGSQASLEAGERFEIGKLHLAAHDFAGAERVLKGIGITPAYNNRVLALFHLGRSQEALAAALDAWQRDPGNLFGLGWAVQLRLYRGDEAGARGLAVPLAQAEARRLEDALGQIGTLLLIGEDQAAWNAFERSTGSDWSDDQRGPMDALRFLLGGGAASRLGMGERARACWKKARAMNPGLALAGENLAALPRLGEPPAYPMLFDLGQTFPMGLINALREGGPMRAQAESRWLEIDDGYLEAVYLSGDPLARGLASTILLGRLALPGATDSAGTGPRAATILRRLVQLPIGTAAERLGFLDALRQRNLLAPGETVRYWADSGLQEVKMLATQIARGPEPSALPPDLQDLEAQSVQHLNAGRLDAAEAALNQLLAGVPQHPSAMCNLVALRARQGRRPECIELARQTIAAHPDYLQARTNLAFMLIEDGKLDEARALLDGLAERPRLHIHEVFELYGVLAMLNQAEGNGQGAVKFIEALEAMVEGEEDERMLAMAKARAMRGTRLGRIAVNLVRRIQGLGSRARR